MLEYTKDYLLNNKNKVSVIITCYNLGCYLSDAVESVINQTYTNWECIIVDDGSIDETKFIAKTYCEQDSRVVYYYKNNTGVADSRNYGVKRSNGEYILILDADDKLGSKYIEKCIEKLIESLDIKIVYSSAQYFGIKRGTWVLPDFSISEILKNNMVYVSALYRRSDFDKIGGYKSIGFEDWNFWLYFIDLYPTLKVVKIEDSLFYYRIRKNSRFISDGQNYFGNTLKIYLNHIELFNRFNINPIEQFGCRYIKNSVEYKIGNLIIFPLKRIFKMFFN